MNDECKKVCEALMRCIERIRTDCGTVPDGFELKFGNDKIQITADVNLEYDVKDEIIEEFIKKSESSEIIEEFINRILKNDKKE